MLRMTPAHQRLDARDKAVTHRHLGLVNECQLILANRVAQLRAQLEPATKACITALLVDEYGLAGFAAVIERNLGTLQQFRRGRSMLGRQADARNGIERHLDRIELQAAVQDAAKLPGEAHCRLDATVGNGNEETIGRNSCQRIFGTNLQGQQPRHFADRPIRGVLSKGCAHVAQAADLDCDDRSAAPRGLQHVLEQLLGPRRIGESGQ